MNTTRSTSGARSDHLGIVRSFSTSSAPREHRIPRWEDHNRTALVDLRTACFARDSLTSTMLNLPLASMRLTDIASNDHVIERTETHIGRTPAGTVLLCLLAKGDASFFGAHGTVRIGSSEAILYDSDEPFMYGFNSPMRQHIFQIPRAKFHELTGRERLPRPVAFGKADEHTLSAFRRIFLNTMRSSILRQEQTAEGVDETFDELFSMLLDSRNRSSSRAHYAMANDFITSNLEQPGLSVGDVASAVGVSERQLSRVFADHGIGVAQSIAEIRLATAHDILTSTRADGFSIGEIANRVGYRHLSHFSRSFKARYGTTARELKLSRSRHE